MRADVESIEQETDRSQADNRQPRPDSQVIPDGLKGAIEELARAAAARKVEPICNAYNRMRAIAAKDMSVKEMLQAAQEVLNVPVEGLIISAYSHRGCFMCQHGCLRCQQCKGTGLVEAHRRCPQCDGIGQVACGFCRGTGWADRDMIPPEIKSVVLNRQLLHVRKTLAGTLRGLAGLTVEKIRKLPPEQFNKLISSLMRMQARLTDLIEAGIVVEDQEQTRMGIIASKIDRCLESLRRS